LLVSFPSLSFFTAIFFQKLIKTKEQLRECCLAIEEKDMLIVQADTRIQSLMDERATDQKNISFLHQELSRREEAALKQTEQATWYQNQTEELK
jgi:hypothetical protein